MIMQLYYKLIPRPSDLIYVVTSRVVRVTKITGYSSDHWIY
jgi:hypothetical protein